MSTTGAVHALDERRRDALGAQEQPSERGVVLGHGVRAVLDCGLRPRRSRDAVRVEGEVALGQAGGHERPGPPSSPDDRNLDPCRLQ